METEKVSQYHQKKFREELMTRMNSDECAHNPFCLCHNCVSSPLDVGRTIFELSEEFQRDLFISSFGGVIYHTCFDPLEPLNFDGEELIMSVLDECHYTGLSKEDINFSPPKRNKIGDYRARRIIKSLISDYKLIPLSKIGVECSLFPAILYNMSDIDLFVGDTNIYELIYLILSEDFGVNYGENGLRVQ